MDATIKEVIAARAIMEEDIRLAVSRATAAFHRQTGLYVSSLHVPFIAVEVVGEPFPRYEIGKVVTLVQICRNPLK